MMWYLLVQLVVLFLSLERCCCHGNNIFAFFSDYCNIVYSWSLFLKVDTVIYKVLTVSFSSTWSSNDFSPHGVLPLRISPCSVLPLGEFSFWWIPFTTFLLLVYYLSSGVEFCSKIFSSEQLCQFL